ncbi:hypothetical protein BH23ACT4_BH23ACT4_13960 [soil metagenome]
MGPVPAFQAGNAGSNPVGTATGLTRCRLFGSFKIIPLLAVTEFRSAISIRAHRQCHGVAVGFSGEELEPEASRGQF